MRLATSDKNVTYFIAFDIIDNYIYSLCKHPMPCHVTHAMIVFRYIYLPIIITTEIWLRFRQKKINQNSTKTTVNHTYVTPLYDELSLSITIFLGSMFDTIIPYLWYSMWQPICHLLCIHDDKLIGLLSLSFLVFFFIFALRAQCTHTLVADPCLFHQLAQMIAI